MLGHLGVGRVNLRLVEAGFADAALEIVRYEHPWHTAEKLESAHVGSDPIRQRLAKRRLGVGVVGSAPDGDEELGGEEFAGGQVDDGVAVGVVDEQLLTGPVLLTHAEIELAAPAAIVLAELGVLVAVTVLFFVFQP